MSRRLGVGRASLKRSLTRLIERGLVQRNPGYGHPMRPEYILTSAGTAIGAATEQLVDAARSLGVEALAFQKWSLPVIHGLSIGANRFRDLRVHLHPVSSRALSLTLKDLEQADIIIRTVTDDYPPVSRYALSKTGERLASLVNEVQSRRGAQAKT